MVDPFYEDRLGGSVQGRQDAIIANPQLVFVRGYEPNEIASGFRCGSLELPKNSSRDRRVDSGQVAHRLVGPKNRPGHSSQPELPLDVLLGGETPLLNVEPGLQ